MKKKNAVPSVKRAWLDFEMTLKGLSPKAMDTLLPGAQPNDLAEAEKSLGFAIPTDVADFYFSHNGECPTEEVAEGVFDYGYFIPLLGDVDSVISEHALWNEICEMDSADLFLGEDTVNKSVARYWLPFSKDYSGGYTFVNCDPKLKGKPGEVIRYDNDFPDESKIIATSLGDFLDQEREKLATGERLSEAEIDDGEISPPNPEKSEPAPEAAIAPRISLRPPPKRPEDVREWLEITVRLPAFKTRPFGAVVQTETMKAMGLVAEVVNPEWSNEVGDVASSFRPIRGNPNHRVAISVYCEKNPAKSFLIGEGDGDGEMAGGSLFRGETLLGFHASGVCYRQIKTEGAPLPIFWWELDDEIGNDVGLMFHLRRRRP